MIPDVTLIASGHSLILYLAKNSIGLRVIEGASRSRDSFRSMSSSSEATRRVIQSLLRPLMILLTCCSTDIESDFLAWKMIMNGS